MRRLLLHVGFHKTGTSVIQEICAKNNAILEKYGYYYPTFGKFRFENHSIPLSLIFMGDREEKHSALDVFPDPESRTLAIIELKEILIQELREKSSLDVLVSGEDLSLLNVAELSNLREFIVGDLNIHKIEIIIYTRNPASLAISGAQEWVRSGKKSLRDVLSLGNLLQAKLKIERIQEVFGLHSIVVHNYDEVVKKFHDIFQHFFEYIGIINNFESKRSNSSMSIEKTLVISSIISNVPHMASECFRAIPNDGSPLSVTNHFAVHSNSVALDDINFLHKQFGINYNNYFYPRELTFNKKLFMRNCHIAINLCRESPGGDVLDWESLFLSIYKDSEYLSHELSAQLAVMGYNCSRGLTLKSIVEICLQQGRIHGDFDRGLFVDNENKKIFDSFNPSNYLALNPDVAAAEVDPITHYYSFGRFMNRKFIFDGWQLIDDQVKSNSDELESLTRNGRSAIQSLSPGWSPISVWNVERQLRILVLNNLQGERAFWFFDANGEFVGNSAQSIWSIGPWVIESFTALFRRIILECVDPIRHDSLLIPELIETIAFELQPLFDELFARAKDLTGDQNSLEGQILNATPSEVQDEVLKEGMGEINIDYSGRRLRGTRAIVINDFVFAYPLFDIDRFAAILFVGFHTGERIAYLDMDTMTFYYRIVPGGIINSNILLDLINHIKSHWRSLRKYFETLKPLPIVGVTRANHFGHRLWNDLTGLHRIKLNGGGKHLFGLIHFDSQDVGEAWISAREVLQRPDLNVVLAGGVKISISQWVYQNNVFPMRIADSRIQKSLTELIVFKCLSLNKFHVPAKVSGELRIVFGLRFENRTWVNQIDGLAELAVHLAARFQKLTIIVDGHDRMEGQRIVSHCENAKDLEIIAQEKAVIHAVRAALSMPEYDDMRVNVIDAVDMELSTSMAWILSADCFVAPWGAGLVKYKWVANLEGIIFSSREVVEKRSDLKIYEDPTVRDDAKECIYLPVEYVSESPSFSGLIDTGEGGSMRDNFFVNMEGMKTTVDKLLDQVYWSNP